MCLRKCDAIGQDTLKRVLHFLVSKQTNFLGKQTYLFVSGFKIENRPKYTFNTDNMYNRVLLHPIKEVQWKSVLSIMCVML